MDAKQKKFFWLSIGLSLAVLLIVIILTFNEETIVAIQQLNPFYLLLAFIVHMVGMSFWAARIVVMCRSLGYKVPFRHSLNMVCAGQLIASITPSQIGGEPVRIHELYKADVPVADATAVVLIERLLEAVLMVLGVIFAMALFSLVYSNGELPEGLIFAAWLGTAFFTGLLILLVAIMRKPALIKKIALKVGKLFMKKMKPERVEKITQQILDGVDQFYNTFRLFAGKAKWGLGVGFLLTFGLWACEFSVASIILMGLGYPPNVLLSIVFQLVIAVILMVPLTPGAAGIAELAYAGFYSMIIPSSVIGLFVVLQRMMLYYSNIVIGLIASFLIVKREAANKKVICKDV
ncbi:MAG TPA: flippase-like domain-containing protein [Methanocorpusculum sp.]|nr:flippase-like domain-containing protein [Methanocorpusculum sp.]HKL98131.1 flippase-like domain-containing protein [Methanocorpusculum sp.]